MGREYSWDVNARHCPPIRYGLDSEARDTVRESPASYRAIGTEMMNQNFSCRSQQAEMMDGDAIGFEDFQKCLRDLEIVNVCTLAYRPTLHWLKKALRGDKSRQPVSILDIGSG